MTSREHSNTISSDTQGKVRWKSPSNIALIKYWGKRGRQVPSNPSLSMTLQEAYTELNIAYQHKTSEGISIEFLFEGHKNQAFQDKIEKYLYSVVDGLPFLKKLHLKIESRNTFPHSAGIASSASAMSALALALCSMADEPDNYRILDSQPDKEGFYRRASYYARLASGSACRSVYGGYVSWGKHPSLPHSSDEFASPLPFEWIDKKFHQYRDAILIVDSGKKPVSSRAGHQLMEGHPFAEVRFEQANKNMEELLNALQKGEASSFVKIVESEALSLHAMMMASDPGFILIREATKNIIEKIRDFREQKGIPLCFTLDAGPNIHLLYPDVEKNTVKSFIDKELSLYCERNKWLDDGLGQGPQRLQ